MSINTQNLSSNGLVHVSFLSDRSCRAIEYNTNDSVRLFKERVIKTFKLEMAPENLRIIYADTELTGKMGDLGINFSRVATLFAVVIK